jgi:hypothetical protein
MSLFDDVIKRIKLVIGLNIPNEMLRLEINIFPQHHVGYNGIDSRPLAF